MTFASVDNATTFSFKAHSIPGYELAADQGADYIECDVAVTKDGMLVCLHDAFLSSVTNIAEIEEYSDRKVSLNQHLYKLNREFSWWTPLTKAK